MRELSITSLLRAVTIALSTGMRYSEIKIDPSKPINSWKEGWESAKKTAGVICRFHDLRHTAVTRMLEGAIALPVVASILGWSAATTVRMVKRYGHIGHTAQRQAVALLEHVSAPTPASIEARREVASHCKWLILNGSPALDNFRNWLIREAA